MRLRGKALENPRVEGPPDEHEVFKQCVDWRLLAASTEIRDNDSLPRIPRTDTRCDGNFALPSME